MDDIQLIEAETNSAYFLSLVTRSSTRSSSSHRIYAPYARQIATAIADGFKPHNDIFIFLGRDAWHKARAFGKIHTTLLLPPEDSRTPDKYYWHFVKGFSVLIMVTSNVGHQLIRHLGYELLNAGASIARALLCYADPPELIIYRGDGKCQ